MIQITDLYSINRKYTQKLDQQILCNYAHIIQLRLSGNTKVINLNHMKSLRVLDIYDYVVGDNGIWDLKLNELIADFNPKITTSKHLTNYYHIIK